ncbi:MAG: hypothetical protein ACYSSI_11190 [Planctomycetota bacterium]|jgi:hypothetical protein
MVESIEKKRRAFSGWPMVVGLIGMMIFAFHASTHMVGAGDTWVAMACGRHFYNHGVDTVEPFSANSHRPGPTPEEIETWPKAAQWIVDKVGLETVKKWHPTGWVNQNWLTHYIFYWLTHESPFADADTRTFNTLVYWKFVIYIITVICVFYIGRVLGVNAALCAVFACFALFVGRSFFDIRPAGFSNLMVAVYLLILVLATYKNILYIWLLVPIAVFWCNLHGGYIYMFIMLVPFVGINFLTSFCDKKFVTIGKRGLYHTIGCGIVTFIATIVFNPFHLTNLTHTFVISVSKHAEKWRTINEWHPGFEWSNPVGTGFPFLVMFILGIGMVFSWIYSRYLYPMHIKGSARELQTQENQIKKMMKVMGYLFIVFIGWVVFISFSFINYDIVSFLIYLAFMGIILLSIKKNVHFIYTAIPFILLVMYFSSPELLAMSFRNVETGYAGRYIYPLLIVPVYVIVHILFSAFDKKVEFLTKNIIFIVLAALASFILMMVLINPFKFESFKNFSQFFHIQRLWRPAYEGKNALNYKQLFPVLYIVNVISMFFWLILPFLQKVFKFSEETKESEEDTMYELPKIDLAYIAIAGLTVYMAIRSRRFITVAAIAACPLMAFLIEHTIRTLSVCSNYVKKKSFAVTAIPRNIELGLSILGVIAVLAFGSWWGYKFKHVYLDPWVSDAKLNSVFMRMTASDAKPFYACEFIRMNKMSGKMFNYWTEGGFIAGGQEPDAQTGRTPLQLFMDGRAQAAYNCADYDIWREIMYGGPTVDNARKRNHKLTAEDYIKVGKWLAETLKKHDVWVVLMPRDQFDTAFVKGLEYNPNWELVFYNFKQRLFVDVSTDKGKKLVEGVLSGETVYPDEFSKNLILFEKMMAHGKGEKEKKIGLDAAIKAFWQNPSIVLVMQLVDVTKYHPYLTNDVGRFCEKVVRDFVENKDKYRQRDGYYSRLGAATYGASYLGVGAEKQKDAGRAQFFRSKVQEFNAERQGLMNQRW